MFKLPPLKTIITSYDNIVINVTYDVVINVSNEDIQKFLDEYGPVYDLFDLEEEFFARFDNVENYFILSDSTDIHEVFYDTLCDHGFKIEWDDTEDSDY